MEILVNNKILEIIEEQLAFEFIGKINILSSKNKQYLGAIFIKNAKVWNVTFDSTFGMKALFRLFIEEENAKSQTIDYIVEPEILDDIPQNIHYPFSIIQKKLSEKFQQYLASDKLRPPANLKVLINEGLIASNFEISAEEFEVLCTISDYNKVQDIYRNTPLLDYEITMALISLRQKHALRVVK